MIIKLESVFVSCKVKKYNKFDWQQERVFAVTEKHIYSFKGKSILYPAFQTLIFIELRRKVPIGKVAALTLSKDPESSEMVIHVSDDWDFRFKSNK